MKINPGYTLKTISGQATVTAESPATPLRNTIVFLKTMRENGIIEL